MGEPAQSLFCGESEYQAAAAVAREQQEREEEEEERQELERFDQELKKKLEGAFDDLEITVSINSYVAGLKVTLTEGQSSVGIALLLHSYPT